MYPVLPSNIDRLASEGIVDFDAEAYVKNQPARFVGAPKTYLPFEQPLNVYYSQPEMKAPSLTPQPTQDEYTHKEKTQPANWKKILTAGLFAGLGIFLGVKYRDKIGDGFKSGSEKISNIFRRKKSKKSKKAGKSKNKKIKEQKISSKESAPAINSTTKAKETKEAVSSVAEKKQNWFSKIWAKTPKWARWTGGIVLGLWGALQVLKMVTRRRMAQMQAQGLIPNQNQPSALNQAPAQKTT